LARRDTPLVRWKETQYIDGVGSRSNARAGPELKRMTSKRKVIPKLEIHKRGRLVDSFLLNTPRLVIGSAPGAHIRLRSAEIETEHLVIELVNRRFLEAVNVAGDPHLRHQGDSFERVRLGRGSVITLGPLAFKLVFVPRGASPPAPEPAPAAPPPEPIATPTPAAAAPVPDDPGVPDEPGVADDPGVADEPDAGDDPGGPDEPGEADEPETRIEDPLETTSDDITDPGDTGRSLAQVVGAGRPVPPRPTPPGAVAAPTPQFTPEPLAPIVEPPPPTEEPAGDSGAPQPETRATAAPRPPAAVVEPGPTPAPTEAEPAAPPAGPAAEPETAEAAAEEQVVAYLRVYPPAGERRKRVRLPTGTFDIGREGCDINLFYEGIAACHASLMVMPDGNTYVQDKGSGLPTIVNGQVVSLSPIRPGDRLQIGTVAFELETVSNPSATASGPPDAPAAGSAPTPPPPPGSPESTAAGAGAWVQAAMDAPTSTDTPGPATGSHPSMPVRRIGQDERVKARSVGTGTDPHVTAREWVRQAIVDSEKRDKEDVEPEDKAPSFAVPPKKTRGPRPRRTPDPRTGPEKVAAARFPEWATTTIPPEYRARKRRRQILSLVVVLIVIGVPTALIAWQRSQPEGGPEGSILSPGGDPEESDVRSVLANTDGAYGGLRSDDEDDDRSSRRKKKSRRSRRSRDRDRSSDTDDGLNMSEAGTDRGGVTYGPGGRITSDRTGSGWGVDPTSDPDLIAIGNPGPGAPVLQFGSPQLGGTMVEDDEGVGVRRVEELEFELAEDADPSGRGSVDMDEVEAVLSSLTPSVRACYTRALESRPDLSGTMVLILTLSSSGQIASSSLDPNASSLTDVDLKRCVERQIKSRNYPIPDGGQVTFSYPFRFNQP